MRTLIILLATLLITTTGFAAPNAEDPESERWFFDLETPGGPLPIEIHGSVTGSGDGAQIVNDAERIPLVYDYTAGGGGMGLGADIPGFDSRLTWVAYTAWQKNNPHNSVFWPKNGRWKIQRRSGETTIPFNISDRTKRFPLTNAPSTIQSGRYTVNFSSSDTPAVGVFDIKQDGTATGTFLTTTGDYRYLAGNSAGGVLKLSTFDGAHAFLFHAQMQDDGSLKGDFWSGTWWHETWTATFDPDAKLPDPFAQTSFQGDAASLERLTFENLEGVPTPVGALAPHGSPRVVLVFGSWCPNCHDATRLLTELHAAYKDRGLTILGLAFEHSKDPAKAAEAVRRYTQDLGVEYPVLIAGLSDKKKAGEALPVLDRVRSYPTTLFIDHDGEIRGVHSGFSGPATGDEHTELRARFIAHIEAMLDRHEQASKQTDMPATD